MVNEKAQNPRVWPWRNSSCSAAIWMGRHHLIGFRQRGQRLLTDISPALLPLSPIAPKNILARQPLRMLPVHLVGQVAVELKPRLQIVRTYDLIMPSFPIPKKINREWRTGWWRVGSPGLSPGASSTTPPRQEGEGKRALLNHPLKSPAPRSGSRRSAPPPCRRAHGSGRSGVAARRPRLYRAQPRCR
jgi:hypothetical protein